MFPVKSDYCSSLEILIIMKMSNNMLVYYENNFHPVSLQKRYWGPVGVCDYTLEMANLKEI